MHVESVAWVAERKDVLSTFFWLLTMWAYVWYAERPGSGRYLLILVCFSLGLMAKSMLVTLPFVLLLLDYWPLGRLPLKGPGPPASPKPGPGVASSAWFGKSHPCWSFRPSPALSLFMRKRKGGPSRLCILSLFPIAWPTLWWPT